MPRPGSNRSGEIANPSLYAPGKDKLWASYYQRSTLIGGTPLSTLLFASYENLTWTVQVIGSATGKTSYGRFSDVSENPATGQPAVAFYDSDDGVLNYATRSGAGAWTITPVATGLGVGQGAPPSLAYDGAGCPRIAFYNSTHRSINLASRNGASPWSMELVNSALGKTTGPNCKLAISPDGTANIAYALTDGTPGDLTRELARPAGFGWATTTVATSSGNSFDLKVDPDGFIHLAYAEGSIVPGALKIARSGDGIFWSVDTPQTSGNTTTDITLNLDHQNQPVMTYRNTTNGWVYVVTPSARYDDDRDGLTNLEETAFSLDPNDPDREAGSGILPRLTGRSEDFGRSYSMLFAVRDGTGTFNAEGDYVETSDGCTITYRVEVSSDGINWAPPGGLGISVIRDKFVIEGAPSAEVKTTYAFGSPFRAFFRIHLTLL